MAITLSASGTSNSFLSKRITRRGTMYAIGFIHGCECFALAHFQSYMKFCLHYSIKTVFLNIRVMCRRLIILMAFDHNSCICLFVYSLALSQYLCACGHVYCKADIRTLMENFFGGGGCNSTRSKFCCGTINCFSSQQCSHNIPQQGKC